MTDESIYNKYPSKIAIPLMGLDEIDSEEVLHSAMLGLCETFLIYITAILFGEYKQCGNINEEIEAGFYRNNKNLSFGKFQELLRLLSKNFGKTILAEKFIDTKSYPATGKLVLEFDLLKKAINDGADNNFFECTELLRKGKTEPKAGLLKFFDTVIEIRNIKSHPEEKAVSKDRKRKWPLNDEYYEHINPLMKEALLEAIDDFDILKTYKPVLAKSLNEQKGRFEIEIGNKQQEVELTLTEEELGKVTSNMRYLLDHNEKLFIQLYYGTPPSVNKDIAQKIMDSEKAKMMSPHLKDQIKNFLSNDGRIDEMELMVLTLNAKTSNISNEELFLMIEKEVKNDGNIQGTVGTPDKRGDIFIKGKNNDLRMTFNPWWMKYFAMVPNISKDVITKQKEDEKKLLDKIDKLKDEIKKLPITKKIGNLEQQIKKEKINIRKAKEKLYEKKRKKRSARTDETENNYIKDIEAIKTKKTESEQKVKKDFEELKIRVEEKEKITADIKNTIESLKQNLDESSGLNQWGIHKKLWKELDQYVEFMMSITLNKTENKSQEEDEKEWVKTSANWSQGALYHFYWSRIYPAKAPLENIFHVGYAIGNRAKWLPKNNDNIDDSLRAKLRKPVTVMWTSMEDKRYPIIDPSSFLLKKKHEIIMSLIGQYEKELLDLGVNITVTPVEYWDKVLGCVEEEDKFNEFITLKNFIGKKDKYKVHALYSRLWSIDDFYENDQLNMKAVAQYETEMNTLMRIFSNVIVQLNDFALTQGINEEKIKQLEDQFGRYAERLNDEFNKFNKPGSGFKPDKEKKDEWKQLAKNQYNIDEYMFETILQAYRLKSKGGKQATYESEDS